MPSTLPVLRMRTCEDNIIKIKTIAKFHKRSVSKELEMILEQYIAEFEKEHGEIEISTMSPSEFVLDIKDRINKKAPYGDK